MDKKNINEIVEYMSDEDISFIALAHEQHNRDIQTALMMERWHKNDQLSQERIFGSVLSTLERMDQQKTDAFIQMNEKSLNELGRSHEVSYTNIKNLNRDFLTIIDRSNNNSLEAMRSSNEAMRSSNEAVSDLGNGITDTVKENSVAMISSVESISSQSSKIIADTTDLAKETNISAHDVAKKEISSQTKREKIKSNERISHVNKIFDTILGVAVPISGFFKKGK